MSEYYAVQRSSDYLEHYGVLGMKWGIHRAAKKGTTYSYQSHATKKYKKAAAKLIAKANKAQNKEKASKLNNKARKYENRAKRSAEIDRGEESYARSLSTAKAIGLAGLGGGSTMKGYAQHRAIAKQKGNNVTGHKVIAAVRSMHTGSLGSRIAKAGYIRQDEKSSKMGRLYNKMQPLKNREAKGLDDLLNRSVGTNRQGKKRRKRS